MLRNGATIKLPALHKEVNVILRRWNLGCRVVQGPISGMLRALKQLNWKMKSPFLLVNQDGVEMNLTIGSPAYLR